MTTSPAATLTAAEHAIYLRRAMTRNGVTVDRLAKSLGVDPRTVTNWRSRTRPTLPEATYLDALQATFPSYDDPKLGLLLEREYDLAEVAEAMNCCVKTVRNRMRKKEEAGIVVDCIDRNGRITFTKAQYEAFQNLDRVVPAAAPVTTGRSKRA